MESECALNDADNDSEPDRDCAPPNELTEMEIDENETTYFHEDAQSPTVMPDAPCQPSTHVPAVPNSHHDTELCHTSTTTTTLANDQWIEDYPGPSGVSKGRG